MPADGPALPWLNVTPICFPAATWTRSGASGEAANIISRSSPGGTLRWQISREIAAKPEISEQHHALAYDTSGLPRECSTTELQQLRACFLWITANAVNPDRKNMHRTAVIYRPSATGG